MPTQSKWKPQFTSDGQLPHIKTAGLSAWLSVMLGGAEATARHLFESDMWKHVPEHARGEVIDRVVSGHVDHTICRRDRDASWPLDHSADYKVRRRR
jgi:hypothetical protein